MTGRGVPVCRVRAIEWDYERNTTPEHGTAASVRIPSTGFTQRTDQFAPVDPLTAPPIVSGGKSRDYTEKTCPFCTGPQPQTRVADCAPRWHAFVILNLYPGRWVICYRPAATSCLT